VIHVHDRVWSGWREAVAEGDEPSILLRLTPMSDPSAAVRAVREVVSEMVDARLEQLRGSEEREPASPGEWEWFGVPGGVLLLVSDCDLFEEMMSALVDAMQRRAVEGVLDVHEWPASATARPSGNVLSCHLRVRGRRISFEPPDLPWFSWEPDREAHAELVTAVASWCKSLGERASYEITKTTLGPIPIDYSDDAAEALREAARDERDGRLRGATKATWREVGVGAYIGGIGLAAGGVELDAGGWRPALDDLTQLLRENGHLLAYARVKPDRRPGVLDFTLEHDWPTRPNYAPRAGGNTREAFEDVPVQLLGPGYAGRIPETPSYRREHLSGSSTLLEHVDLAAWFDHPFAPSDGQSDSPDTLADVLARARTELQTILYTPGALNRAGYTDLPGL
jgi:hypothetical protein